MSNAVNKTKREKVKIRIRKKISGTPERPRLSVFRSNSNIYAQVIDDLNAKTLVSVSSLSPELKASVQGKNPKEVGTEIGKAVASKCLDAKIESVVFDRNGYLYHGRVKAVADGAREGGLKF